ncbi:hypothetical protein ACU8DI_13480 [Psychroserpens sp. BH13MA-6]
MKNLAVVLGIFLTTISYAQETSVDKEQVLKEVKLKDFGVSISIDSAEELESTFTIADIREILGELNVNEDVSFEVVCNGDKMSNGKTTTLTYKVNGNTSDINSFLKSVNKIRNAAINYYSNK